MNDNYQNANQRTILGFRRALQATWIRFYGESDLHKGGLKLVAKLKWKKVHDKYEHTPVKYTQRVETLYALLREMDGTPGTTPMPTP